jgi:hypothetical protein
VAELDRLSAAQIKPMERENMHFFDHKRERARTDGDQDVRPRAALRALLG